MPRLRVSQGKIHYIDRAAREPFELQVQNLDLSFKGSALTRKAAFKLAASVSESREQNIKVEGRIGPYGTEREWMQYPLDLQVNVDSVLVPTLTRALPVLREKIPAYFGINGPLSIKANLSGTLQRPKIRDLSIAGPLFGAAERNTSVTGDLDLSANGSWKDAVFKGKVVVNPVALDRLRSVPFLQAALPAGLSANGPLSIAGELSGRPENLNVHALVTFEKSEVRLGEWLKKDKGLPGQLELNLQTREDRVVLETSQLILHNLKLKFSGGVGETPDRLLTLRVRLDPSNLTGWDRLIAPLSSYQTRGTLDFDLSVRKALGLSGSGLELRGGLNLTDVQAREKNSGRGFDQLNSKVSFLGKRIRVERSSLRLGSSTVAFEATVPDLSSPVIQYTLWSPKLSFTDLTGNPATPSAWMKDLKSTGVVQNSRGQMTLKGNVSASQGSAEEILYRNLQGEISWSPSAAGIKGFLFHALGGTFRADGAWEKRVPGQQRVALDARLDGIDLKALLMQKFPNFKDRMAGKLDLTARLRAEGNNGSLWHDGLQGDGETEIHQGILKDVNLVERVLGKVAGLPGISDLLSSALRARHRSLLQSRDTAFDKLAATFIVADKRIHTRNLLIVTPDYTVRGEGSIGFDRTIRWSGELVMSPQFTQELVREHRNARYLLDRQGKLAVPFRLEGTLPQVQAKPDTQWLAERIQRGLVQRGMERALGGERERKGKERQDWIQKGLEKFFGK
ncbi:MAG: DUF748 domain-containing protein [Deltaproteobacteria bacterium]|nr:DUF748 domain-containing protein [Deltaproteobacteria bacterium]